MFSGLRRILFGGSPTKAELQGHKRIRLGGAVYVIRKINPLLDFPADKMPTVFTSHVSSRKVDPARAAAFDAKRTLEDMMMIVKAGVVEPPLAGPEVTIEDVFRIPEHGAELYLAVMDHSLNKFRGLKKLFFSAAIRQSYSTAYRKAMALAQAA